MTQPRDQRGPMSPGWNAEGEAQGQHRQRRQGKRRLFAQHAARETDILQERLERRQPAAVAIPLFRLLDAAERDDRLAPSLDRRHAGLEVIVDVELEMTLHLRVELVSAQTHALGFYERLGYRAYGAVFDDAGLPHQWMTKVLPAD